MEETRGRDQNPNASDATGCVGPVGNGARARHVKKISNINARNIESGVLCVCIFAVSLPDAIQIAACIPLSLVPNVSIRRRRMTAMDRRQFHFCLQRQLNIDTRAHRRFFSGGKNGRNFRPASDDRAVDSRESRRVSVTIISAK